MEYKMRCILERVKSFLRFTKRIKSFYKFYNDYEYDGETCRFIVEQYTQVLCNRTHFMSKPTYYAGDVIRQLDEWYSEHKDR